MVDRGRKQIFFIRWHEAKGERKTYFGGTELREKSRWEKRLQEKDRVAGGLLFSPLNSSVLRLFLKTRSDTG